jgi:protein required for attachment to host cells
VTNEPREKFGDFLLPNAPTYIVAGASAEARIFLSKARFGDWTEVTVLTNPDAGIRERDRVTDRPGRAFDSFGKGRHAMSSEETGRQHTTHRFALEVGSYLNRAMVLGAFEHLVLIADPTFLGYLRPQFTTATKQSVSCELPMNASRYDMNRLKSLFA